MKSYVLLALLMALATVESTTKVHQCKPKGGYIEDDVDIDVCKGVVPCKLPKKSRVNLSLKFSPETDVKKMRTHVSGEIASIPLPFLGVDGTLVCNKIYKEDGTTKAPCPLKAGQKYIYKDSFDVLQVYPKVKVLVRWSLHDDDTRKQVTCFEVPAEIVS